MRKMGRRVLFGCDCELTWVTELLLKVIGSSRTGN